MMGLEVGDRQSFYEAKNLSWKVYDLRGMHAPHCASKLGRWIFWKPFSHPPRTLVIRAPPSLASRWVFTPPPAGPAKIRVKEARGRVGKLPNPPYMSCWGRKVLCSVSLVLP